MKKCNLGESELEVSAPGVRPKNNNRWRKPITRFACWHPLFLLQQTRKKTTTASQRR
jgi:hypothetical protein